MTTETKEILTVDDLAERWGCSAHTVLRIVNDAANPVPAIPMGRPTGVKKRRLMLRFRRPAVERWEAAQERTLSGQPEPEEPAGRAGYDGPIYTGKGARKKGRARSGTAG